MEQLRSPAVGRNRSVSSWPALLQEEQVQYLPIDRDLP